MYNTPEMNFNQSTVLKGCFSYFEVKYMKKWTNVNVCNLSTIISYLAKHYAPPAIYEYRI